jgi:hypothetical protein
MARVPIRRSAAHIVTRLTEITGMRSSLAYRDTQFPSHIARSPAGPPTKLPEARSSAGAKGATAPRPRRAPGPPEKDDVRGGHDPLREGGMGQ